MTNLDIPTQVFCSQCDRVTDLFVEWAGEFWCNESCSEDLPTEAHYAQQLAIWEAHQDSYADEEWLASAGWGTDEDYGGGGW